jgi:Uncharacterized protein conserved in bacteria (DUF2059)
MQILQRSAVLIFALCLTSSTAFADNKLKNQELIEKSGLAAQLKELPGAMQASVGTLRQQGAQVDAKFEQAWGEAALAAYGPEKSLPIIDQGLQKLLAADDKKVLLTHFNSPLGRRLTELEVKASQPTAQAETQAYAQKLMADPSKHADRLALYQAIDQATGATTLVTEIAMNVAITMSIGMVNAMQGPKVVDTNAIRAEIEKQRFAMTQQIASGTLATMAYAYRDVKIQDLKAYLAFLNSPAAKKYNAGVGKLLNQALSIQSEDFGKRLAQNLGRKGV